MHTATYESLLTVCRRFLSRLTGAARRRINIFLLFFLAFLGQQVENYYHLFLVYFLGGTGTGLELVEDTGPVADADSL